MAKKKNLPIAKAINVEPLYLGEAELNMKIGGLQKITLIDYPKKIAATVFLCGCNFRCPMCHNPELFDCSDQIKEADIVKYLKSRQGMLDGVCITGGEPTINPSLPAFIQKIKDSGFLVKLDSNGSNPQMLKKLYEKKLIDYIAVDIKTSLKKYSQACGIKFNTSKLQESVEIIRSQPIDYEFRSTVVPSYFDESDVKAIGKWLKGSRLYVLQQYRSQKTLDKDYYNIKPYSDTRINNLLKIAKPYFQKVVLRK